MEEGGAELCHLSIVPPALKNSGRNVPLRIDVDKNRGQCSYGMVIMVRCQDNRIKGKKNSSNLFLQDALRTRIETMASGNI